MPGREGVLPSSPGSAAVPLPEIIWRHSHLGTYLLQPFPLYLVPGVSNLQDNTNTTRIAPQCRVSLETTVTYSIHIDGSELASFSPATQNRGESYVRPVVAMTEPTNAIASKQSLILDLPPSCIEFCLSHPKYFVVGTYDLVKDEEPPNESEDATSSTTNKPQDRNGSLIVYQLENGVV